jgi:hypothetical protein
MMNKIKSDNCLFNVKGKNFGFSLANSRNTNVLAGKFYKLWIIGSKTST